MKKIIGIGLLLATCLTFGQKKTNGTIYIDHPGIIAVEAMTQARVSGDAAKVASYLGTDFKYYSGTNPNETIQGKDKVAFAEQNKWMNDNISYYSISRSKGAYPDAFEYKRKDESYDVHTWENFKGMHNKTGVKIDMPVHSIYTLDKNNKITMRWYHQQRNNCSFCHKYIFIVAAFWLYINSFNLGFFLFHKLSNFCP